MHDHANMASADDTHSFSVDQLDQVLSFLQAHFPDAAEVVLRDLKEQESLAEEGLAAEGDAPPSVEGRDSDEEGSEHDEEQRAKSAELAVER